MERVAELLALAVENALTRQALKEEKERLRALLEVNSALVTHLDLEALIPAVAESIRGVIKHDYASLALREGEALHMYPLVFPLGQQIIGSEAAVPLREAPAGRAILDRETKFFNRAQLAAINSPFAGRMLHAGVQSLCCVPLQGGKGILGTLNVGSTKQKSLDPNELGLLTQIASQFAISLEHARAYREITELKKLF